MTKTRITARDAYGRAYVPGYAPQCGDEQTCQLIILLTDKLAEIEDQMEKNNENHLDD